MKHQKVTGQQAENYIQKNTPNRYRFNLNNLRVAAKFRKHNRSEYSLPALRSQS
jgi:hypothetical protein